MVADSEYTKRIMADCMASTIHGRHTVYEARDDHLGVIRLEKWDEAPRFVLWVGGMIVWKSDQANEFVKVVGPGCACPPGANLMCRNTFCPRGRDGSPIQIT